MVLVCAGFSAAFTYVGLDWAKYIVALGALLGIVTGVLVGALGVARLLTTVGREHMLPSFFAYVHPTLGTPLVSTLFLGIVTGESPQCCAMMCPRGLAAWWCIS